MNVLEKIDTILKEAAASGTLTIEALSHIQKIRDESALLEKSNQNLTAKIEAVQSHRDSLKCELEKLREENAAFRSRQIEVREQAKANFGLELKAQHAAERVTDHINMVKLIFRNAELRKTMYGEAPQHVAGHADYNERGGTVRVDETKTETVE